MSSNTLSESASGSNGLPRVGQGTLTEQTTKALLEAVLDHRFPGDRLPAEPELAETLKVSRTTIRAALQSLERHGILSRAPGRGTLVRPHVGRESIVLQRLIGFRSLLEEKHADVEVLQKYWIEPAATAPATAELSLPDNTPVVTTSKLFMADGKPAIHIADQIPLSYCSPTWVEQLRRDKLSVIPDSIFAFSTTWPGRQIDHTVVEVKPAVVPDVPDFPLDLRPGTPYIVLLETHYTALGEPVAFSTVDVDDEFVRFHVVRQS